MVDSASVADLAAVGAGMAVVIGVVALLTSAEVAKRLQALVEQKLDEADVKLQDALAEQDQRITTLRQYMSQLAEDNEAGMRAMSGDLREIKSCIALMSDAITSLEADMNDGGRRRRKSSQRASNG